MAWLTRPGIAARNSQFTHLANGVLASRALLPAAARADRVLWPDDDTLKRLTLLPPTDPALRKTIDREWLKVKTGSYEPAPAHPPGKARPKIGKPDDKAAIPAVKKRKRPGETPAG